MIRVVLLFTAAAATAAASDDGVATFGATQNGVVLNVPHGQSFGVVCPDVPANNADAYAQGKATASEQIISLNSTVASLSSKAESCALELEKAATGSATWYSHDAQAGMMMASEPEVSRTLVISGYGFGAHYDGGHTEDMIAAKFTHVGPKEPSSDMDFVVPTAVSRSKEGDFFFIAVELPEFTEDATFTISLSLASVAGTPTIPFVGSSGRDRIKFTEAWNSVETSEGQVSIMGGGFSADVSYQCQFTDIINTIKKTDAVVESPHKIECGKVPAGFKIADDGPYTDVTVAVLDGTTVIPFVGDSNGNQVQVDTCFNGVKDGTESDVDCGGHCSLCDAGKVCAQDSDCEIGCTEKKCRFRASCRDVPASEIGAGGVFDVKFDGDNEETQVYCAGPKQLMDQAPRTAGEGWTLLAVRRNPQSNSGFFTWQNRQRAFDGSVSGSPNKIKDNYKSRAYSKMPIKDLLFYADARSGRERGWIQYNDITDKSRKKGQTFSQIMTSFDGNEGKGNKWNCYRSSSIPVFKRKDGSWSGGARRLCNDNLYFSPADQDGGSCGSPGNGGIGPCWNAGSNNGCPMDDPGGYSCFFPWDQGSNRHYCSIGWISPYYNRHHNWCGYSSSDYIQVWGRP